MKRLRNVFLAGASALIFAPSGAAALTQPELERFGADLGYRFTIADNRPDCPPGLSPCFLSYIDLHLPQPLPDELAGGGFTLYVGFVTPIRQMDSDLFDVRHLNGDLYALTPKPDVRLSPGQSIRLTILGEGKMYSTYFALPNAYVVASDPALEPVVVAATRPATDPETGVEYLPFVSPMTDEARLATKDVDDLTQWLTPERSYAQTAARSVEQPAPDIVILPRPATVERLEGAALDVTSGVTLSVEGVAATDLGPALDDLKASGVPSLDRGPKLSIVVAPGGASEGYQLTVQDGAVTLRAADSAGASHGLRSLAQQTAFERGLLRPVRIEDAPRFGFRGVHVDVARNFHSKALMLKIIEQMAVYKLNRLHLHLGDDEGWRLEIKALPELATTGATRCHDPAEDQCLLPQLGAGPFRETSVNGAYSQADYLEILAAAKARHIEVIPSFDMPGHSRAAIRAMEARYRRLMAAGQPEAANLYRLVDPDDTTVYDSIQHYNDNTLNVCIPQTYRFLDTVMDEIRALHDRAGVPLKIYHIGADETAGAWSGSPACQALMQAEGLEAKALGAWFIQRVARDLSAKGIVSAGWSDGMGHTDPAKMPAQVQSNIWSGLYSGAVAEAHEHANRGWQTVISIPDTFYFDIPQSVDPLERGYDWPSRVTDSFEIFAFMPENLAANATWLSDLRHRPARLEDKVPLQDGRYIAGLQGQVWSEVIRTDATVEYMLFPRLLALAERAWHRAAWEPAYSPGRSFAWQDGQLDLRAQHSDWQNYRDRMAVHLGRLDLAGIPYRIAPVGAITEDGHLKLNAEFDLPLEYRLGTGEWQSYAGPVALPAGFTGTVTARARSADGHRPGRSVVLSVRP